MAVRGDRTPPHSVITKGQLMKYIFRKLGFYVVALWAALTLNFFLPRMMPGNPVDQLLSKLAQKGPVTPATRHALELLLGADNTTPVWQ